MTSHEDHRGDAAREIPRPRDMPPPREADGAAAPAMRRIFDWPYRAILAGVVALRLSPMQLTFLGLATNVVIGWLLVGGHAFLAGLLLIPAGLFDVLDGAFWMLSGQGQELEAALALATLVISLAVSHIRAEAEAVGVSLSEGLFQRLERYLAMMIGLMIPGMLLPMLVLLTALGGFTML